MDQFEYLYQRLIIYIFMVSLHIIAVNIILFSSLCFLLGFNFYGIYFFIIGILIIIANRYFTKKIENKLKERLKNNG